MADRQKLSSRSQCSRIASNSRSSSATRVLKPSASIASLPRFLPTEHRADLGAAVAAIPRPEARQSLWRRVIRAAQALDDSMLGDALGAVMLFVLVYGLWLIAAVMG